MGFLRWIFLDIQISSRTIERRRDGGTQSAVVFRDCRGIRIHPILFGVLSILSFPSICGNSNSTSPNRETRSESLRNVSRAFSLSLSLSLSLYIYIYIYIYIHTWLKSYRENVNTRCTGGSMVACKREPFPNENCHRYRNHSRKRRLSSVFRRRRGVWMINVRDESLREITRFPLGTRSPARGRHHGEFIGPRISTLEITAARVILAFMSVR